MTILAAVLILALLYTCYRCRRLARELSAAYDAITALEADGMIDRALARVQAYDEPVDALVASHERCERARELEMTFERR